MEEPESPSPRSSDRSTPTRTRESRTGYCRSKRRRSSSPSVVGARCLKSAGLKGVKLVLSDAFEAEGGYRASLSRSTWHRCCSVHFMRISSIARMSKASSRRKKMFKTAPIGYVFAQIDIRPRAQRPTPCRRPIAAALSKARVRSWTRPKPMSSPSWSWVQKPIGRTSAFDQSARRPRSKEVKRRARSVRHLSPTTASIMLSAGRHPARGHDGEMAHDAACSLCVARRPWHRALADEEPSIALDHGQVARLITNDQGCRPSQKSTTTIDATQTRGSGPRRSGVITAYNMRAATGVSFMDEMMHQFVRVDFERFKALKAFSIDLRQFNILVGPNNAGKSTILAAFRILAAALRHANSRNPTLVRGPDGTVSGYGVDLTSISVAEENIFYDYDDSQAAIVTFTLSNRHKLILYFPEQGTCSLVADANGKTTFTTAAFRSNFNCPIGFVPILGPVEHHEPLFQKEAARLALFNYRASRNFRNIWYHYPERFEEFREAIGRTWPGMDIERPEIDRSHEKPRLYMFCPEQRKPRELFWSGFGFQVWCQMLTHLIQSKDTSLFLIDEPDIYLHSELQRQLLGLLRNLGPDILLATHSTEIVTEAETDDILLVNKTAKSARRIRNPNQLAQVFSALGSNINPILTQLAKTRRALFVEGKDFQILGKFSLKLKVLNVGNRRDFAVVPIEGFNPERIRNLVAGMETTLGGKS